MSRLTKAFTGIVCALVALSTMLVTSPAAAHDGMPHWVTLFNGKDLDNWTHAKGAGKWKVDADGSMTQADKVDYCTIEEFEDFLLEVEFHSEKTGYGNSGVYLRGAYEVQIFNSTHGKSVDQLAPSDGGGIYGHDAPIANPHNPQGEWNKYTILMHDQNITVWINGVLVQDNVKISTPTAGAMPVSRNPDREGKRLTGKRGPIMLQGDHDRMWFRNLRLLELPEGFKPLWNGKDLSEFTMRGRNAKVEDVWKVKDNAFFNAKWGDTGGRDIWTKGSYGNFLVHYEYKSNPSYHGGNGGFYLRDQWELQIFKKAKPGLHNDAAFYSTKAPDVDARNGNDEWNVMDVKLVQNKAWVWQNGKLVHDGVELVRRTDNKSVKTKMFSKAPFKLQGDHGQVWFRNLFIKELPDDAKPGK